MKHLIYSDHQVNFEEIILDRDDQEELISIASFQELIDYPFPVDGLILLVLNSTEGMDFSALKNKYLVQKIVILSNALTEEQLSPIMRENNWIDLFYPTPVTFSELLGMHKVITGIYGRTDLGLSMEGPTAQIAPESSMDLELNTAEQVTQKMELDDLDLSTQVASTSQESVQLSAPGPEKTEILSEFDTSHTTVASTGKAELRAELKVEQEQGQMGQILALKDEQLYKSLAHNQLLRQKVQDLEKRTDKLEMDAHYWKKKSDESKQEAEEVVLNHKLIENNFEKEKDEYKHKLMVLEEKVKYWEQKFHEQKLKNSELSSKQHMDHKSIKRREDELEERLSLLHSDSGMQIQVREKKIMELKRKVDLLDFDLQESVLRESEMKERIKELEKKLEHSVSTLRSLFRELEIKPSSTLQMRDVSLLKKVD
jgi:hypothetical protein